MPELNSTPGKLAYRIDEAVQVSGLGRTFLYEYIGSGKLPSIKVGGRRLILHDDLLAFLKGTSSPSPASTNGKALEGRKRSAARSQAPLPGQMEFPWPRRG
ncbi:helix-turn-helix domain-containing protein [Asticcacaulis sp. MM231]|uniref:helix-turn-helix domain-containing protein n=1 Tax=Asticcacaulis sp. MM231 TaxID=3157666 RepID=UPI0032D5AF78